MKKEDFHSHLNMKDITDADYTRMQNKFAKILKQKLYLLTVINLLLMVEKGISGGICQSIYLYAKANNKYMNILIKIKNCHIFNIGM